MDAYKDDLGSGSRFSKYIIDMHSKGQKTTKNQPNVEEEEEEEGEIDDLERADYIKMLDTEKDEIISALSSGDVNITTQALKRVVYFARSRDDLVFQRLFSYDIISSLSLLYTPLYKKEILTICFDLAYCSEEVILNFMEIDIYRMLIQSIYEGKEEEIKILVPIFLNIVDKTPLTACLFYASNFICEAANGLEEDKIDNIYTIWFITVIVDCLIKNRVTREISEFLNQKLSVLGTEYPGIQYDTWIASDYANNPLSLRYDYPVFRILNHLMTYDLIPEADQVILHTLCMLSSVNIGWGIPSQEHCNIILNEMGFVPKIRSYADKNDIGIMIQLLWIIAQIVHNTRIWSIAALSEFCWAISEAFKVTPGPNGEDKEDIYKLYEITLYAVGELAYRCSKDSDIFSPCNIRFVRSLALNASYKVKSMATLALFNIEKVLKTYDHMTGEFLSNAASLIGSQETYKKISWLELIYDLIEMNEDNNDSDELISFIDKIRDNDLYEAIQDIIDDDDNDEVVEKARSVIEICDRNNGEYDFDFDF